MIVDPGRSGDEPGQEADHGTQAAGNRPNLREEDDNNRMVSLIVSLP